MSISIWTALLMLVATVVGSAVIVAACCFAAVGFAALFGRLVGPSSPEPTVEEQARRAEAQRRDEEEMERRWEERARERGRPRADSTAASFRVFGGVFLAAYLLVSLSSVLAHAQDPGRGFPLQLALRPLWFAFAVALMAGIMAGSRYQRQFRRLSPRERREFLECQRAEARSAHARRLARVRRRADPRRLGGRH
jgi:hypothetical protein